MIAWGCQGGPQVQCTLPSAPGAAVGPAPPPGITRVTLRLPQASGTASTPLGRPLVTKVIR